MAQHRFGLSLTVLPPGTLPTPQPKPFFDLLDRALSDEIRANVKRPFWIDTVPVANRAYAEFIAAGGQTVTWADFEAAMAEWVVDLEVAKAAQRERKRQKALKKRESRRRKKEEDARAAVERSAEIQARWGVADKAGKENDGVWPACEK